MKKPPQHITPTTSWNQPPNLKYALTTATHLLKHTWAPWLLYTLAAGATILVLGGGLGITLGTIGFGVLTTESSTSLGIFVLALSGLVTLLLVTLTITFTAFINYGSINAALTATGGTKPTFDTFFELTNLGRLFVTYLITVLISGVPIGLLTLIFYTIDPTNYDTNILYNLLILVTALLTTPLITIILHLAVDEMTTPRHAIQDALSITKPYYLKLIGYFFLTQLIAFSGVFLLGFGLIATIPLAAVANAILYRQLIHGTVPVIDDTPASAENPIVTPVDSDTVTD